MITVLHYLSNLGLGGTEKTCQLFFEHLPQKDYRQIVFTDRKHSHPRLDEFVKSAKVCGGEIILGDPADLKRTVDACEVDIVHTYRSGFPEFPEAGLDLSIYKTFVETNVFGFINPNPSISKTLYMSEWLMHASLDCYKGDIDHSRFDFVNNPVESPYSDNKMQLDIPEDHIVLGRCGRPDNGIYHSLNVRAARLLQMQGYKVYFLVMAAPPNMILELEEHGIPYHAIDPTCDPLILSEFYNTVDIYCHARADGETFGVNIAEAMVHGCPVVTHIAEPSVAGMGVFQSQTTLVDTNLTGFVVENDQGEYAHAVQRLINSPDLRNRFGEAGRDKANSEYHVDACVLKLDKIYKELYYDTDSRY